MQDLNLFGAAGGDGGDGGEGTIVRCGQEIYVAYGGGGGGAAAAAAGSPIKGNPYLGRTVEDVILGQMRVAKEQELSRGPTAQSQMAETAERVSWRNCHCRTGRIIGRRPFHDHYRTGGRGGKGGQGYKKGLDGANGIHGNVLFVPIIDE